MNARRIFILEPFVLFQSKGTKVCPKIGLF
jgi:hypothetical protein